MSRHKLLSSNWRLLILFVSLNLIFIFGISINRSTRSAVGIPHTVGQGSIIAPPKVLNKTRSLEVINIDRRGRYSLLTLKNNYNKIVISFSYCLSTDRGKVTVQHSILPGETLEEEITIPGIANDAGESFKEQVTILSVLFDDSTGDGELASVEELKDREVGQKIQIDRINSLFQALSVKLESNVPSALSRLESKIISLEDPPDAIGSFALKAALHDQKELALLKIRELRSEYNEQGFMGFQKKLKKVKENYKTTKEALSKN